MIRRSIDDGELGFYHCHNPNHAGFGELVNVAGAGPSKNVSPPARTRSGSTNTRSENTTHGTDISPSPCSPTHSSPSPHTRPKKGAPATPARKPNPRPVGQPNRARHRTTNSPTTGRPHPRRNTQTPQ